MTTPARPRVLVLDNDQEAWTDFYRIVAAYGDVAFFSTLADLLEEQSAHENPILFLDVGCLRGASAVEYYRLQELRSRLRVGLVTDMFLEQYLADLRYFGIFQVLAKQGELTLESFRHFVQCLEDPKNGFGLSCYLRNTCEVHRRKARTLEDKHLCINDVMDYFATNGYDIHHLYDVRLVLEESLNNAFFHAYKDAREQDKYRIKSFQSLSDEEQISVEFGSTASVAGFSVTDGAGTLSVSTVLHKLERQLNREGLFDESGRGLYLCRILSSITIINIEQNKRTQIVALFDEQGRPKEPKPFILNYSGSSPFPESPLDPELD